MGRLKAMTVEERQAWVEKNLKAEGYLIVDEDGLCEIRYRALINDLTEEDLNRLFQSVASEELKITVKPKGEVISNKTSGSLSQLVQFGKLFITW